MNKDRDDNSQGNNQGNSGSGGGNLPKPDPDLSDYHRRDGGDSPHIKKR